MFPYVPLSFFPRGRQYVCDHIRTKTGEGYYSIFKTRLWLARCLYSRGGVGTSVGVTR